MTRFLFLLILALPVSAGCLRKYAQSEANRTPTAHGAGELTKNSPARPTPESQTGSPGIDAAAPVPLLEAPQLVRGNETLAAGAVEPADPPLLPGKEKRIERREQRRERKEGSPAEKPKLPSPFVANPTLPETTPKTAVPPAGGPINDLETIKKFYALTVAQWAKVNDFEARLVKREVVNGKDMPTEEVLYRYRKSPMSVYMKNIGERGKGREILYVDKPGAKIHVVTGQGDQLIMRPGLYLQLDPDSPLVTGKSRQKISEAGFSKGIEQVGKLLALAEKGQFSGFKVIGETKRREYPYPLQELEIHLKPGEDPNLSKGGVREVYVDPKPDSPSYGLPVVVRALDHSGREVEYYAFDRFKIPANFTDADFSPERLNRRR
ncbi:MAG TPA: DUF1571 domain-containing protein [Fimbriiglobus sp.]|jgi:hypothetical protein